MDVYRWIKNNIKRACIYTLLIIVFSACSSQFNKGVTNKKELRSKKSPSVKIVEDYDKQNKKRNKTYRNTKQAGKAREKQNAEAKKRGDKYLKKKRRKRN